MEVTISVNEEAIPYIERNSEQSRFRSTVNLVNEFDKKGHDLTIIHPRQVYSVDELVYTPYQYKFKNGSLIKKENEEMISGDVFYVNHVAEDSMNPRLISNFLNSLYLIEKQVGIMLNDAASNSYRSKEKQRTLPIPWIKSYSVNSKEELEDLIVKEEKIIGKPKIGSRSIGVHYFDGLTSLIDFDPLLINNYVFEKYMPEQVEKRYIFLDGKVIMNRVMEKVGSPAKEKGGEKMINPNPDYKELEIAKTVADMTGMFFGSVDFRQEKVMEINSSSTSVTSGGAPQLNGYSGNLLYNLKSEVVDAIEKKTR